MYSDHSQYQAEVTSTYFNGRAAPNAKQPAFTGAGVDEMRGTHANLQGWFSDVAAGPAQYRSAIQPNFTPMTSPQTTADMPSYSVPGAQGPTKPFATRTVQQQSPFASGEVQLPPLLPNNATGRGLLNEDEFIFCSEDCPTMQGWHANTCPNNWTPPPPKLSESARKTTEPEATTDMLPTTYIALGYNIQSAGNAIIQSPQKSFAKQPLNLSSSHYNVSMPLKVGKAEARPAKQSPHNDSTAQITLQPPLVTHPTSVYSSKPVNPIPSPGPPQANTYNFSDRDFWNLWRLYTDEYGEIHIGARRELFAQGGKVRDDIVRDFGWHCLQRPSASLSISPQSTPPKQSPAPQQLKQPHQQHMPPMSEAASKMIRPNLAGSALVQQTVESANTLLEAAREDAPVHNTATIGLPTGNNIEDKVTSPTPVPDTTAGGAVDPPKVAAATNPSAVDLSTTIGYSKLKIEGDDWCEVEKKIDEVALRYYNALNTDFDHKPLKVQKFADDVKADYMKKQTEALNEVRDALSTNAGKQQIMKNCKALAICTIDTHKFGIPTQIYNIIQGDKKKLDRSLKCSERIDGVEGAFKANKRLALDVTRGIKYAEITRSPHGMVDARIETCRSNFVREKGKKDTKNAARELAVVKARQQAEAKELAELKVRQQEDAKELAELRAKQKTEPSSQTGGKRKRGSKAELDPDHDGGITEESAQGEADEQFGPKKQKLSEPE